MKICIVARNIPDDGKGNFEFDQAMALKKYGHQVCVISMDLRSIRRKRKFGISHCIFDGIDLYRCSFPIGAVGTDPMNYAGSRLFRMVYEKAKKEVGPFDIINTHFLEISAMVAIALKNHLNEKTPLIVTEHSSLVNKSKDEIDKKTQKNAKLAYSSADCVIAVSESLQKKISDNFNVKCQVVYNVFDGTLFSRTYREKKVCDGEIFTFVSAGNLTENKRMGLLVEAFATAFPEKTCMLYIFGDGPERENLRRQIENCGMRDSIVLCGKKSRSELAEFYKQADAFVLLSKNETFGVAYIEAMACGLPVIASYSGGPESFINDENGIIVDDDICKAAAAMNFIKDNISAYNSESIAAYANRICSSDIIAEKLTSIYTKVAET